MIVSGLQKLTLLDYPGKTACIIFTRGCNFRCPFCHNADLVIGKDAPVIKEAEVFAYLEKRKKLLEGVVISGGEPLLHKETKELIARIKGMGFAVKLDTNGSFPQRLRELLDEGLIDYVAMDIKNGPDAYGQTAGVSFDLVGDKIRESIRLIMTSGVDYEFRTTVAWGLHTEESVRSAASLIKGAKRYFIQNYKEGDTVLVPEGQYPFNKPSLERFVEVAREFVPDTFLRGEE